MLNWPPGNIFRQDSEPKWLQIHQNLFENTRYHPPKKLQKDQTRQIFWKPICVGKRFRRKSTSYGSSSRSAKWKVLVHWSSVFHTFFKNSTFTIQNGLLPGVFYLNPSCSRKNTFSFGAIWDLFLEEYSLWRRVRHNSKIESKNDLLNNKCTKMLFSWEMTENEWARAQMNGPNRAQQMNGPNKWMGPTGPKWMGPTGPKWIP